MSIYLVITVISIIGIIYPKSLYFFATISAIKLIYDFYLQRANKPKSKEFKEIKKLKQKQEKKLQKKHRFLEDQIDYIAKSWGFTKTQKAIIEKFLEKRAYEQFYTKLSASLLPQLILLIDECNAQEKRGCKAEVNRRVRELIKIIKDELKNQKVVKKESFETTLDVFDYLLKDAKN